MGKVHIVEQGEHLPGLAKANGFFTFRTILNDPENAALKEAREENPGVLFPGESVFIPDLQAKDESGATGRSHKFVLNRSLILLRIAIRDVVHEPIAATQCDLLVEGQVHALTTDADG